MTVEADGQVECVVCRNVDWRYVGAVHQLEIELLGDGQRSEQEIKIAESDHVWVCVNCGAVRPTTAGGKDG